MTNAQNLKYQDRPISGIAEDLLDREPFVDSLARALVRETRNGDGIVTSRSATGNVVGLVGKWGLGKSSILKLLKQKFERTTDVSVVLFNPWLFKGRDELLHAFFNSMRESLGRSTGEKAEELMKALDDYWDAIDWLGKSGSAIADTLATGGTATAGWKFLGKAKKAIPKPKPKSVDAERENLESKLAKHKTAVVVLIDEVDRVEDEEVRAVAQLIKALGDIRGISYLVAYDQTRVVDALGRGADKAERARTGALYLEKIVQHPVPLRPLFTHDVDILLAASLTDHGVTLATPTDEHSTALYEQIKTEITTPREVKRLVGSYAVLEEAVRGEIHPIDLLAYCWILTKNPSLRDAIEDKFEKVIDDPGENEQMMRMMVPDERFSHPASVVDNLGDIAAAHEALLSKLFPRFGSRREPDDGTRLSLQRNLLRLLYLGNPPGMVRRDEVEKLWAEKNPSELRAKLDGMHRTGRLRALINRLDDHMPNLSSASDQVFWTSVAQVLIRPTDFASGFDERGGAASDAIAAIVYLGARNPAHQTRVRSILDALIDMGDLTLAPGILRKQLFAHGMTRHDSHASGRSALTCEETQKLLDREMPRYQAALLSGALLKKTVNLEAIYALSNVLRYGPALRASLTDQLDTLESIATIATLVVPPGYGAERKGLDELFDTEEIKARIDSLEAQFGEPADPWVAGSLKRLRSVVQVPLLDATAEEE